LIHSLLFQFNKNLSKIKIKFYVSSIQNKKYIFEYGSQKYNTEWRIDTTWSITVRTMVLN